MTQLSEITLHLTLTRVAITAMETEVKQLEMPRGGECGTAGCPITNHRGAGAGGGRGQVPTLRCRSNPIKAANPLVHQHSHELELNIQN